MYMNLAGNRTLREYYEEDFLKEYNIDSDHGMFTCNERVVPSGPHYLILFECKQFSKNQNGHMEYNSESK